MLPSKRDTNGERYNFAQAMLGCSKFDSERYASTTGYTQGGLPAVAAISTGLTAI